MDEKDALAVAAHLCFLAIGAGGRLWKKIIAN
jgi:hypothetical protein